MGHRVQQGDVRTGEVGDKHLGRDVSNKLGESGGEEEAVRDGDIEIVHAETEGEPDDGEEDQRREQAFGIEDKGVVGVCLGDHIEVAGESDGTVEKVQGSVGGVGGEDLDPGNVTRVGDKQKLQQGKQAADIPN